MQIKRLSYQVRGFVKLNRYAIRYNRMVTEKAKHKARVIGFWDKHGIQATIDAFKDQKMNSLSLEETKKGRLEANLKHLTTNQNGRKELGREIGHRR